MVYGIHFYDSNGNLRVSMGDLCEEIVPKLYDIPGWPPYKVRSTDLQVVSFHPTHGTKGYELKKLPIDHRYRSEDGYNLFYKGKRSFIGLTELRKIVNQNEGKVMATASQRGGLKTGDLIVGSYTKNYQQVSFASDPTVQPNITAAKQEAARLAVIDKNKKFVVVEVKAVAAAQDIVWE